jgi:hypothetical protein
LRGNYIAGSFVTTADGQGGILVTHVQTQLQPLLTRGAVKKRSDREPIEQLNEGVDADDVVVNFAHHVDFEERAATGKRRARPLNVPLFVSNMANKVERHAIAGMIFTCNYSCQALLDRRTATNGL